MRKVRLLAEERRLVKQSVLIYLMIDFDISADTIESDRSRRSMLTLVPR